MRFVSSGWLQRAVVTACLGAGLTAVRANDGPVSVAFINPNQFLDVGELGADRANNLKALKSAIETLASPWLASGQVLHIDVLDVDLAGTVHYNLPRRSLRIVTGSADWPRMTLRYRLEEDGHVLQSGEEQLSDMSFLNRLDRASERDDPLRPEKRMLENWFRSHFNGVPAQKG